MTDLSGDNLEELVDEALRLGLQEHVHLLGHCCPQVTDRFVLGKVFVII